MPLEQWKRYKYIVHLDGNTAAFRLANTMRTGSAILKQDSPFVEYWYDGIRPDVHYRRVRANLADLPDQVRFLIDHDQEARRLAQAAEAFAAAHLTRSAVCAYVLELLEAYASLPWRDADDQPTPPAGRWQALWSRIRG